jgi:uncharacterized membrane protein YvbJ
MAMTKCPECGREVLSNAPSCPNCGNPINMKSGPFGGYEKGITVRPGFWHDRNVGAIGCFALIIIIIVVAILASR